MVYLRHEKLAQETTDYPGKTEPGNEGWNPSTDVATLTGKVYNHTYKNGSTAYFTDTNGSVWQYSNYDEWGNPRTELKLAMNFSGQDNINPFTTYEYDTVLEKYFAQYRMYDSENKRFTAVDPVKNGLNWYEYCGSNPVLYTDPLGLYHVVKNGNGSFRAVDNVFFWVSVRLDNNIDLNALQIKGIEKKIGNHLESVSSLGDQASHDILDVTIINPILAALNNGTVNGYYHPVPQFDQNIAQLSTIEDDKHRDAGGLCWVTCVVMLEAYLGGYNLTKEEADARIYYLATNRSNDDPHKHEEYWNVGGNYDSIKGLYNQGLINYDLEIVFYGQIISGGDELQKQADMLEFLLEQISNGPLYVALNFIDSKGSGGHAMIISGYFELGGNKWLIINDPQTEYLRITKFETLARSSIYEKEPYRGDYWWIYSGIIKE